jgi:cytidylate kinase
MSDQKKQYITLENGIDFRAIATIMTRAGFKMNHATARNQLMSAMQKLLTNIVKQTEVKIDREQIEEMMNSQEIHSALADVLHRAYLEMEKEKSCLT